jgi:hypothetical protein
MIAASRAIPRWLALPLAIEQQRQPFGVGEIAGLVLRLQLDEGIGQAELAAAATWTAPWFDGDCAVSDFEKA